MTRRLYETAETLVYDPVIPNRNATRASLHTLGFRKIEFVSTLEALTNLLQMRCPDLLLCEAAGAESEVCAMIQSIRQGKLSTNPFCVIVATTWRRDGALVNQILNCGADDLLARPFSTAVLADRVRTQVERRKGFVVTSDYIGPDRRRDASRSGPECMKVPNSLNMRSTMTLPQEEADRRILEEIKGVRNMINSERMRRNAFQLCVQWRLLEQRRPGGRDFAEVLVRINMLADEIAMRCSGTAHDSALEWCESLRESVRAIRTMTELARVRNDNSMLDLGPPMHLLGHAALTLGQIFAPGEVRPTHLVELDALVAGIDVKNHPMGAPPPDEAHREAQIKVMPQARKPRPKVVANARGH